MYEEFCRKEKRERMLGGERSFFSKIFIFCMAAELLILAGRGFFGLGGERTWRILGGDFKKEASGPSNNKIKIVLDGSIVTGNDTAGGQVCEKDVNDEVVRELQKFLENMGAEVFVLNGTFPCSGICGKADGDYKNADLLIHIQCGFYEENWGMSGLKCYYYQTGYGDVSYADYIVKGLERYPDINCNGVKQVESLILKDTSIPEIVIELGNLLDREDGRKLARRDYRRKIAYRLAECIMQPFMS